MSKKQKALEGQIEENVSVAQDKISEGVIEKNDKKQDKNSKDNKDKKKNKKKKDKEKKGGLVKKTKETVSELKKVSWPSFKSVVKNTGVVIVVVLVFTVVLFGIDRGLAALYNLIPR